MRIAAAPPPGATGPSALPGPELPALPPTHPGLPAQVPSLAELEAIAAGAPARERFVPGSHPSTMRNAHYSNTRAQLGFALAGPYNSLEGDVRLRDGVPVMQHDGPGRRDLTFEQWAELGARAGKHLRVDVKEAGALAQVEETLRRIGIPEGSVTFSVATQQPWNPASMPVDEVRALRERWPGSWFTLSLAAHFGPVYALAVRSARAVGGERLGVTVTGGFVGAEDVAKLRTAFAYVNAWNEPWMKAIDIPAETARLRAIGVNGMIDLRRRDDPLARD